MTTRVDPYPPVLEVVNDPTYTPIAANRNGDVLATPDGTILLVSSTLKARGTHLQQKRHRWLEAPQNYPLPSLRT